MKLSLCGVSSVALAYGLAFAVSPASAQEAGATVETTPAPAQQPASSAERVVVTGQLIAGASEDAPNPVEVFNLEDLEDQGAPTAAEFLRSLPIASEALGEADSNLGGAAAGFANVNLRGIGASRTLVLLNGRRFASTDGGLGADINTLPTMAVGSIEILKDGASVTYGAGAVGGVINYVTRKNFEGVELSAERKLFDGSAGEEEYSALWGLQGDQSNLLLAASWGKRHELGQTKRDFATQDYSDTPAIYTTVNTNPAAYFFEPPTGNSAAFGGPFTEYFVGNTIARDYTPETCRAIGGEITRDLNDASSAVTANDCSVYLAPFFNLVDEEIYTRAHVEFNADLSDTSEFHFEFNYGKTDNPNVKTGAAFPNGGTRTTAVGTNTGLGYYTIPVQVPVYNTAGVMTGTVANPYAQEFLDRATANGAITRLPFASPAAPTTLYTESGFNWRPLMFGGHPLYESGTRQERVVRERFGGNVGIKGEFTEDGTIGQFLPFGTTYEYAATYSEYSIDQSRPTFIISRLQDAMRGYGGPNCAAIDRVATDYSSAAAYDASTGIQSDTAPGTNGCEYFNPFASSFATSYVNGAANPAFGADPAAYGISSFENSIPLLSWLTHNRRNETTNRALTIDAVFTGEVPGFELPGGPIGWALGTQWRQTEARTTPVGTEEEIAIAAMECPWGNPGLAPTAPGQSACEAQTGPFFGSALGRQFPTFNDRQTTSYFGEVQLPVLDNLNVQLAARREEFGDVSGDIWKIAAKYDLTDSFALRGSYSTNFQAPAIDLGAQGIVTGASYQGALFRSVPTFTITQPGITPEEDTAMNFGAIYENFDVLGGDFRASLDYWNIEVDGEVGSTNVSTALIDVFGTGFSATTLADCSADLVDLVDFTGGACVQGASTAANVEAVTQYNLNQGGFDTAGIDLSVFYSRDLGPGTGNVNLAATRVTKYDVVGYGIPGVVDVYQEGFDGLGFANLTRSGTIMPEWRGNLSFGYVVGDHRFNLRYNYVSGFTDENAPVQVGLGPDGVTGTADDEFATFGLAASDYSDVDFSWIYTPAFDPDLQLRLSVLNVTDENPMPAQNTNAAGSSQAARTGYYTGYGNPRGRQFEIGITKNF